jgi:hypothetical protein
MGAISLFKAVAWSVKIYFVDESFSLTMRNNPNAEMDRVEVHRKKIVSCGNLIFLAWGLAVQHDVFADQLHDSALRAPAKSRAVPSKA